MRIAAIWVTAVALIFGAAIAVQPLPTLLGNVVMLVWGMGLGLAASLLTVRLLD